MFKITKSTIINSVAIDATNKRKAELVTSYFEMLSSLIANNGLVYVGKGVKAVASIKEPRPANLLDKGKVVGKTMLARRVSVRLRNNGSLQVESVPGKINASDVLAKFNQMHVNALDECAAVHEAVRSAFEMLLTGNTRIEIREFMSIKSDIKIKANSRNPKTGEKLGETCSVSLRTKTHKSIIDVAEAKWL